MSTQTIFNPDNQSGEKEELPVTEQNVEAFADQLAQILNDNGEPKYKDVSTALNALKASQEFIPSLKQEKETLEQEVNLLREELTKRSAIEDVVEKLKQQPPAQEEKPNVETPTQSNLSPEQIRQLLEEFVPQIIDQRQEQSVAQKNIYSVDQKLKEFYGEKVEESVKAKAESLGLSIQDLEALSAKSPASALELLGVKEIKPSGKTFTSSVNIPLNPKVEDDLKPTKSMLLGATGKEQAEYLRRLKEDVMKRNGYSN